MPDDDEHSISLRRQTILAQFGELALRSNDLDEILTEACRLVGEALGTDFAKVVELQPDGKTLLVRAGVGWKDGVIGVATILAEEGTSESYALKTGEPMISPDIDQETRFKYAQFLIDNGAKAIANVIIIGAEGRLPFGILQIDSRKPRQFTDADIAFLRGYANLLAATVDRLRVIDEMRDGATRLRLALEAGELASFEIDLDNGSITRTARYDEILGFGSDVGPTDAGILARVITEDRPRVEAAMHNAIANRTEWKDECRIRLPGSDLLRWIEVRGRPEAEGATPTRMIGIVADITERKLAEHAVAAMNTNLEAQVEERTTALGESNAQLDAFAYTVSHDLRAPLRAMEGFARILLDDFAPGLGPEGERFATRIVGAAKRMETLIDDLLALSRVQRTAISLQSVDPARAVRRVAGAAIAAEDEGAVTIDVAESLLLMTGDRTVVGQVLTNLIGNAAKFRKKGQPVHIAIRSEQLGDRVRLIVEDNGIGIAEEHRARIFNVFERLHGQETYAGTGVGLAIVKAGMERMGGSYGLSSTLGVGSAFWIELAGIGKKKASESPQGD